MSKVVHEPSCVGPVCWIVVNVTAQIEIVAIEANGIVRCKLAGAWLEVAETHQNHAGIVGSDAKLTDILEAIACYSRCNLARLTKWQIRVTIDVRPSAVRDAGRR